MSVDRLVGVAVGEMGMSLHDFDAMTEAEFTEALRAHTEAEQRRDRSGWERARAMITATLAPYSRSALNPRSVLPLPWDNELLSDRPPAPQLSREQIMERYRAAVC